MSKYYKEHYCVSWGVGSHATYSGFDSFSEAWKCYTYWKDHGVKDIKLVDSSDRTPEHPAYDTHRAYSPHIRIA